MKLLNFIFLLSTHKGIYKLRNTAQKPNLIITQDTIKWIGTSRNVSKINDNKFNIEWCNSDIHTELSIIDEKTLLVEENNKLYIFEKMYTYDASKILLFILITSNVCYTVWLHYFLLRFIEFVLNNKMIT